MNLILKLIKVMKKVFKNKKKRWEKMKTTEALNK